MLLIDISSRKLCRRAIFLGHQRIAQIGDHASSETRRADNQKRHEDICQGHLFVGGAGVVMDSVMKTEGDTGAFAT